MIRSVHTPKAPKAVGPYSPAIAIGDWVFCSGQIGIDPKTGKLVEGIEKQVKQAVKNLHAVLEEAGSDLNSILKTTIFITNMADYGKVNEVYGSFFPDHKPARSTIGVAALPANALVEIECIAIRSMDMQGGGGECACGGNCGH